MTCSGSNTVSAIPHILNECPLDVFLHCCTNPFQVGKNNCLEYWLSLMILQWAVNDISREEKPYARDLVQHQRIKSAPVREPALLMPLFTWWDLLSACKAFEGRRCFCLSFPHYIYPSPLFFLFLCASRSHHASPAPFWIYITEFSNLSRSCDWTNNLVQRPLHQLSADISFSWWGYQSVSSFLVCCFHSSPSPLSLLCGSLLWMSI